MPRLNRTGELWCAGIAGDGFYAGDFVDDRARLLVERHPAGMRGFLTEEEAVTQVGDSEVRAIHCRTGADWVVSSFGAGEVQAGGGAWASFLANRGGVRTSFGLHLPSAYVGASTGPMRNDCVGPDGQVAIRDEYHSTGPWRVHRPDRVASWLLSHGDVANLQLLGGQRAIFREGWDWKSTGGAPVPRPLTRIAWALKLLETPAGDWIVYQAEDGRVLAHPNGETRGRVLGQVQDAFGLDAVVMAGGRARVIWARMEGERPHSLDTQHFRFDDARLDLHPAPPIVVPAPAPPPSTPESTLMTKTPSPVIELLVNAGRETDRRSPGLRQRDLNAWANELLTLARLTNPRVFRKSAHAPNAAISPDTFAYVPQGQQPVFGERTSFFAVSIVRDNPHNEGGRGPNEWRETPEDHGLVSGQFLIEPSSGAPAPPPSPAPHSPAPPVPVTWGKLRPVVADLQQHALELRAESAGVVARAQDLETMATILATVSEPTAPAPHTCPPCERPHHPEASPLPSYDEQREFAIALQAAHGRRILGAEAAGHLLYRGLYAKSHTREQCLEEARLRGRGEWHDQW